jgi:hypothetical protein
VSRNGLSFIMKNPNARLDSNRFQKRPNREVQDRAIPPLFLSPLNHGSRRLIQLIDAFKPSRTETTHGIVQ